jgi:hypothetical protein
VAQILRPTGVRRLDAFKALGGRLQDIAVIRREFFLAATNEPITPNQRNA